MKKRIIWLNMVLLAMLFCHVQTYAQETASQETKVLHISTIETKESDVITPSVLLDGTTVSYRYVDSIYSEKPSGVTGVKAERTKILRQNQATYLSENGSDGWKIGGYFWTEMHTGNYKFTYADTTGFSLQLPSKNYTVTVTFTNPTQNSYQVRCWDERGAQTKERTVYPGKKQKEEFQVSVIDGNLKLFFHPKTDARERSAGYKEIYIESISIKTLPGKNRGTVPTIFLIGDSITDSKSADVFPREGWGQEACYNLGDGKVLSKKKLYNGDSMKSHTEYQMKSLILANWALSGESTKSSWEKGRLDAVLNEVKPGDYVLVMYGHNDSNTRRLGYYVKPEQYKKNLTLFAKGCKERGAACVFLSSVPRYKFVNQKIVTTAPSYKAAMKSAAAASGAVFVDTGKAIEEFMNTIGEGAAKNYYMFLSPGQYPNYLAGYIDKTHFNNKGAKKLAQIILRTVKENPKTPSGLKKLISSPSDYYKDITVGAKNVKLNTVKKKSGKKVNLRYKLTWKKQKNAKYYIIYRYVPSQKTYVKAAVTKRTAYVFQGKWTKEQVKKMKVRAVLGR